MPVCYIIDGPTCAGKTTLAKECVKTGRILVPSYCFHVSNVGSNTPAVEDLHYFGEHTPTRIDGESYIDRQRRILYGYSLLQMNALNRVCNGESIVMDFSTLGIRAFTKALAKGWKLAPVFPSVLLQRPVSEFYDFVKSLKKSGADVYVTLLCPPGRMIAERLAHRNRNGDDAWGRDLTNKIAIEYQEVAREIMLSLGGLSNA